MRIIAACILAFFATSAGAENLVINDARIQYTYSFSTHGPLHFCDFVTTMAKAPMVIKLTAAFITDDTKPKDKDVTIAYIVEAFIVGTPKGSNKLEPKEIKVVAGRIISDIFNSDLHAVRNVDKDLGASYTIPSQDSLALFTNVLTLSGAYTLAVDFENNSSAIVKVSPTPDIFGPSGKWSSCSIAIMEHRPPQ